MRRSRRRSSRHFTEALGLRLGHQLLQQRHLDGADLELGPWRALFRLRGGGRNEGPTLNRSLTELQSRQAQGEALPPFQVRVRQGASE